MWICKHRFYIKLYILGLLWFINIFRRSYQLTCNLSLPDQGLKTHKYVIFWRELLTLTPSSWFLQGSYSVTLFSITWSFDIILTKWLFKWWLHQITFQVDDVTDMIHLINQNILNIGVSLLLFNIQKFLCTIMPDYFRRDFGENLKKIQWVIIWFICGYTVLTFTTILS